jgi:endonuclease YncB( thermonuclease family)
MPLIERATFWKSIVWHQLVIHPLAPLLLVAVAAAVAKAEVKTPGTCPGARGETVQVRSVTHQLDVVLVDKRTLRIRGLRAPGGTKLWPELAEMARFGLAGWIEGQSVQAEIDAGDEDRWGRRMARLWIAPGTKNGRPIAIGPGLIEAGWAFANPGTISKPCRPEYLRRENIARAGRLGLWHSAYYTPLNALDVEALNRRTGEIVLAEGQVLDVRSWKSLVFVNFSKQRGKGLGLMLTSRVQRDFLAEGIKPDSLKGRTIRVRGLLEPGSGPNPAPRIRLTGPASVEFLNAR